MFALAQGRQSQSPTSILARVVSSLVQGEFRIGFRMLRRSGNRAHGERHTHVCFRTARGGQEGAEGCGPLLRRMAALDLDPKEVAWLEPAAFRDLQRVCTMCKSHRRCAWDFARKASLSSSERYCPNTSTLAGIKRDAMACAPGVVARRGCANSIWRGQSVVR